MRNITPYKYEIPFDVFFSSLYNYIQKRISRDFKGLDSSGKIPFLQLWRYLNLDYPKSLKQGFGYW